MKKWIVLIVVLLASHAAAVTTSHWSQTNEADFKAGKFHNVVATNHGRIAIGTGPHAVCQGKSA